MLTILAIAVGFSLVTLTILGSDRVRARRLTPTPWPLAASSVLPSAPLVAVPGRTPSLTEMAAAGIATRTGRELAPASR